MTDFGWGSWAIPGGISYEAPSILGVLATGATETPVSSLDKIVTFLAGLANPIGGLLTKAVTYAEDLGYGGAPYQPVSVPQVNKQSNYLITDFQVLADEKLNFDFGSASYSTNNPFNLDYLRDQYAQAGLTGDWVDQDAISWAQNAADVFVNNFSQITPSIKTSFDAAYSIGNIMHAIDSNSLINGNLSGVGGLQNHISALVNLTNEINNWTPVSHDSHGRGSSGNGWGSSSQSVSTSTLGGTSSNYDDTKMIQILAANKARYEDTMRAAVESQEEAGKLKTMNEIAAASPLGAETNSLYGVLGSETFANYWDYEATNDRGVPYAGNWTNGGKEIAETMWPDQAWPGENMFNGDDNIRNQIGRAYAAGGDWQSLVYQEYWDSPELAEQSIAETIANGYTVDAGGGVGAYRAENFSDAMAQIAAYNKVLDLYVSKTEESTAYSDALSKMRLMGTATASTVLPGQAEALEAEAIAANDVEILGHTLTNTAGVDPDRLQELLGAAGYQEGNAAKEAATRIYGPDLIDSYGDAAYVAYNRDADGNLVRRELPDLSQETKTKSVRGGRTGASSWSSVPAVSPMLFDTQSKKSLSKPQTKIKTLLGV